MDKQEGKRPNDGGHDEQTDRINTTSRKCDQSKKVESDYYFTQDVRHAVYKLCSKQLTNDKNFVVINLC